MSEAGGRALHLAVDALRFDPESGELTGPAGRSRLAPQPASLLTMLASRPGELVTRDEIRERLWPGGRVEFEQGIAFAVREVRRAIEAAGGDPALLETIPKRGYRLKSPNVPATTTTPTHRPRHASSLRLVVPPLGAVAVIAAIGLGISTMGRRAADLSAVVVFVHDTEEDRHVELSRALGYELTTALTRAFEGRLGIIGPTGSAVLSGPNDTEGARASLGACLVVSGGIRAAGNDSVVVFTQVVRTLDRVHAWASQDTVMPSAAGSVVSAIVAGVESAAGAC